MGSREGLNWELVDNDIALLSMLIVQRILEADARTSVVTGRLMSALWRWCLNGNSSQSNGEDSDSDDDDNEIVVGPYGPRDPSLRRVDNQDLLRQCLLEFPVALTGESPMPARDELEARADESDEAWLAIMVDLTKAMPMANPLSAALMAVMVDELAVPSQETFDQLIPLLVAVARAPATSMTTQRNVLILVGSFAERYAGPGSEAMLTDDLLSLMMEHLQGTKYPLVLSAVLALEKLSQTRRNKERALEAGVAKVLVNIEARLCAQTDAEEERMDLAAELWRAQVGFCAMWALDNVFPASGRQYTMERVDVSAVNVMLDVQDATKHLKLAADGLEARNDHNSFESVKATCSAHGSGLWYYEATVFTPGIMQIGWATDRCAYQSEEGVGIGDDIHSYAYDGCRGLLWHGPRHYAHQQRWKPGDVLGSLIDLDRGLIYFSLNGHVLQKMLRIAPGALRENFYPAASLMTFQHVLFNFGNTEYRYMPRFQGAAPRVFSLNETGNMTAEQKKIVPRLVVLEQLRREREEEEDLPRCQICFDEPPNCMVRPCKHADFCAECASKCDRCPLCRVVITAVEPLVAAEAAQKATADLLSMDEGVVSAVGSDAGAARPPVSEEPTPEGFDSDEFEDIDSTGDEDEELISA